MYITPVDLYCCFHLVNLKPFPIHFREEEACSHARVLVGVRKDGTMSHVRKAGRGALDPKSVMEMSSAAQRVGVKLNAALVNALELERSIGEERRVRGFLD